MDDKNHKTNIFEQYPYCNPDFSMNYQELKQLIEDKLEVHIHLFDVFLIIIEKGG